MSTISIKLTYKIFNSDLKWWKNLSKITKLSYLSVTLWSGAIHKKKLKRTFLLQLINKMNSKADNKNKRRKKSLNKTMWMTMMKIIKITKVLKNRKLRNKNLRKKSKFSTLFGKTQIINREFHYQNINGSNNWKIKFLLLKNKMSKFLLFVLV